MRSGLTPGSLGPRYEFWKLIPGSQRPRYEFWKLIPGSQGPRCVFLGDSRRQAICHLSLHTISSPESWPTISNRKWVTTNIVCYTKENIGSPHHLTNLRHGVCNGLPLQTITMDVGPAGHYESDGFLKLKSAAFLFRRNPIIYFGNYHYIKNRNSNY